MPRPKSPKQVSRKAGIKVRKSFPKTCIFSSYLYCHSNENKGVVLKSKSSWYAPSADINKFILSGDRKWQFQSSKNQTELENDVVYVAHGFLQNLKIISKSNTWIWNKTSKCLIQENKTVLKNQIERHWRLEPTLHICQNQMGLHLVEQNSWGSNEYLNPTKLTKSTIPYVDRFLRCCF